MRTTASSADMFVRMPPRDPAMCSPRPAPSAVEKQPPPTAFSARQLTHRHQYRKGGTNNRDDDDLDLPEIKTKPLSSAASIARFHGINAHGEKPRRVAGSTTASSRERRHRRAATNKSDADTCDIDKKTTPVTNSPTKKSSTKKRVKYHTSASAKQFRSANRLSALVIHSVTPRECSALATNSSSFPGNHTEYDIVVENVRVSQIWQVSRRFSTFDFFRKELTALFATPHCHFCTEMNLKIDVLHENFPRKRLWGSNKPQVIQQRAEKLQTYLQGLVALGARTHTTGCRHVASSFSMILRSFLTVEGVQFNGIPGGGVGYSVPSLLQEMSGASGLAAGAVAGGKRAPLATIQENSAGFAAFLGLDENTEDEEEDDTASTSDDNNQREVVDDEDALLRQGDHLQPPPPLRPHGRLAIRERTTHLNPF